jgi:hypothetical protein
MKRSGLSVLIRPVIVGLSICALAGCAQLQDSFGEISDPDGSRIEYLTSNSQTTMLQRGSDETSGPRDQSDPHPSERGFSYGGIKLELSDGAVVN